MDLAHIKVQAGPHRRRWCPARVALPADVAQKKPLQLYAHETRIDSQIATVTEGKSYLLWIIDELPAGDEITYILRTSDTEVSGNGDRHVHIAQAGEGLLDVFLDDEKFTTYNYGASVVRPYLYPVYARAQAGITRNWPMVQGALGETNDHPHHKGIYTAQGDVNGVDNWGEDDGSQKHKSFLDTFGGPICGGFVEELEWVDSNGKPNMAETRKVTVYRQRPGIRLVDYEVNLHACFGKVVLGDTKEGGLLSVRVASSMDGVNPRGGIITNSFGGMSEEETWGKRAHWCDYSGPVEDRWFGITMMDHPENPRHPTPWHVRDYGLMTANCFGFHDFTGDPDNRHDLTLEADQTLTWKYRIYVHAGGARDASVSDHYLNFAFPPKAEVSIK